MHKDLIKRWDIEDNKMLRENVFKYLKSNKSLEELGLGKINGRWDLRGIKFPRVIKKEKVNVDGRKLEIKNGGYNLLDANLQSIDLSYADLSECVFVKCNIENCLFESTILKNIECLACSFTYVSFIRSNLSNSFLALNRGSDSGAFKNVEFLESNLSKVSFRFPSIEDCKFIDCKLHEVNFDGSRMVNCKFKGKFESGWINGYSRYASKSVLGLFYRVNPEEYINPMTNIDFSEAELEDVLFGYKVDLRKCKFPESGRFVPIVNLQTTYAKAKEIIQNEWSGEEKKQGLFLIDNLYYSDIKKGMPIDYIDTTYNKHINKEFQDKFFGLIKSISSKVDF